MGPASRPRLLPTGPRAAARRLLAVLLLACPAAGGAGVLTRERLARSFPEPFVIGDREKEIPVWPIFKQSGPPHHTVDLVGYVFESADLAPVPGFSGTPVDLLIALDTAGNFLDVTLLTQHEPVFLGGVGEDPLVRFLGQYKGLSLQQNLTIGGGGARVSHPGSTSVYLDGISKATASVRIINQSVLAASLKVARAKLGFSGGRDPDLVAHVRTDLYQPRSWQQLLDAGLVQHRVLLNRDVEQAFAGGGGAGLDPEALARPGELYCDLYAALVTIPMAGRNLLTDAAWATLVGRTQPGDHVLLVMSRGRHRLVTESFQRNTVPDRLSLRQSGLPIEMRDLDIEDPLRSIGQPEMDQAMTFRVIFQAGLDPGEPMQISTRVTRSHGVIYPDRYQQDFILDYAAPGRFIIPAAEDQKTWRATWKDRRGEIAILGLALALLTWVLSRQPSLVTRPASLRWFRRSYLVFTLVFIGWYAQGQLSIVNVVALLQAAVAWRSWAFFLYDPMTAILSIFTLATLLVWGRGTFCGWLCPFGALQELAATVARWLHLPRVKVRDGTDRRLKGVKYAVLAVILVAAIASTRWSDALVEVEPFKTAITMRFERTWGPLAWAVSLIVAGAFVYKAFCRYLCPFGAALALGGRLRRWRWLTRRLECGHPCQTCRSRCEYQAIERSGAIDYTECFQCLDCVSVLRSDELCAPRLLQLKGRPPMRSTPPPPPAAGHAAEVS
jgi:NosR/NirI family transcriptional regulator, nitrous oxide reductase regulator